MKYHGKAMALIGSAAQIASPDGVADAEERIGSALPASVREWYTEVDGRLLLNEYSNADPAVKPVEFDVREMDGKRIAFFQYENQSVCWWGFDLDGGEDPPVYVNFDPPPDKIYQYSTSFSEYTYVRVFDALGWVTPEHFQDRMCHPLTADDVDVLRDRFRVEPMSYGWPGTETHRFSSKSGRIVIWQSDEQADWMLSSNNEEGLFDLQSRVADVWRPFR